MSTGDLSKGLSVVASTSASMGNSMEETIGMMTAITEQTRNASKASRGLNQIFSRLSQVTSDTSSTGKKLTQIYNDLGIQLYDLNTGQLRSSYDILSDLADRWDTLDTNTQNYIALTSSGSNQLNNFLALMNNFQHATEATNTALESQGSANQENARYMESLTAHITALKAAFQDLSRAVLESGFLESLLDVLTKIVQTLADNPWLVQIGVMTAGITSIAALTKNFLPILAAFTGGLGGLSAAAGTAGAAGALGTFATVLGSIAPYALAASAAIVGLIALYKEWKDAHPDLDTMNEKLQTNKDRLDALNKIPYASRTTEIQDEIDKLEAENKKLQENINLKKQASEEKEEQIDYNRGVWFTEQGEYKKQKVTTKYEGKRYTADDVDELLEKIKKANPELKDFEGTLNDLGVTVTNTFDSFSTAPETLRDYIRTVNSYNSLMKNGQELTAEQAEEYKNAINVLTDYNGHVQDAKDSNQELNQIWYDLSDAASYALGNAEQFTDKIYKQVDAFDDLKHGAAITTANYDELIKRYPQLENYMTIINGSIEEGNALWGVNVSALSSAAAAGDEWAVNMINDILAVANAQIALNRASAEWQAAQKSHDYSPSSTQIQFKGLQYSQADYYEMLQALNAAKKKVGTTTVTGVPGGGGGASKAASKAQKEQKSSDDEHLEALKSIVSLRKSESDLLESSNAETNKQIDKYHEIQSALHNQAQYMRGVLATMKKQGKSQKEINEYQESINSLSKDWWSYQSKITSLIEKQAEAKKKAAKEALEERKKAAEEEQDELEKIAEYAQAVADAQIKKIDEQIDALDKVNDELDDQIQKQQLLEALATAKSKQLYVYKDGQFQYVEDTESISKAQQDLADFEREQRQKKEKEALEAEKQRWEDYKDGWGDLTKSYTTEQGKLLYEQKYGADIENQNWTTRLRNLADFVSEYNSLLSQINSIQTQLDMGQYGDMYLDQATQEYIEEQKRLYNEARARGDWKAMEEANKNANEARGLGRVTTATGDIAGVRGGGTSSGGGGGGGSYTVGSGRGQSFLNEAPAGSTMTGADGSRWTKNNDGSTTITRGGETYHVPAGSSTGKKTSGGSSKSSSSKSSSSGGSALKNAISNAIGKVIGKKKAHGTYSAEGGLTLVGENGPELRVLNQGDGILPTNLTRSLFQVASNPSLATMRNSGNISTHINISNVTLPNVKDAESLVDGLKNLAYQRAYART